jgi:hypothetical protein
LQSPNTVTVCNYTTPLDVGVITQISIYLTGSPEGSNVTAVIYADSPDSKLPNNQQLLAKSKETLNITSTSGEWYNFTMNYAASPNTTYWIGYFSDSFTRYNFDKNATYISGTSSASKTLLNNFPGSFTYSDSAIMSLYVAYTREDPKPASDPPQASEATSAPNPLLSKFLSPETITAIFVSTAATTTALVAKAVITVLRRKNGNLKSTSKPNTALRKKTFTSPKRQKQSPNS